MLREKQVIAANYQVVVYLADAIFCLNSWMKRRNENLVRAQGNRILKPEHFEQVVFIQCGFQSFGLHPALDAPLVL